MQQFGRARESTFEAYNKFAPDVHAKNRIILGTVEGSGQPFYVPINALRQHVLLLASRSVENPQQCST